MVQKALGFFAGGLAEEVDDKVLHAAFIPFGDITDIQIPLDYETGESFSCLSCSDPKRKIIWKHSKYAFQIWLIT